jgi:hypothetical protein
MLTSNEDPTIAENTGILYVIPQSQAPGAMPTPALKNLVLQQVTEVYPCTLTFQVSVQDPVYKTVDVAARIFLFGGLNGHCTTRESSGTRSGSVLLYPRAVPNKGRGGGRRAGPGVCRKDDHACHASRVAARSVRCARAEGRQARTKCARGGGSG